MNREVFVLGLHRELNDKCLVSNVSFWKLELTMKATYTWGWMMTGGKQRWRSTEPKVGGRLWYLGSDIYRKPWNHGEQLFSTIQCHNLSNCGLWFFSLNEINYFIKMKLREKKLKSNARKPASGTISLSTLPSFIFSTGTDAPSSQNWTSWSPEQISCTLIMRVPATTSGTRWKRGWGDTVTTWRCLTSWRR